VATRSEGEQSTALPLLKPLAAGGSKDSHGLVIQISDFRLTQAAFTPQPHPSTVNVFAGDPPIFLFSVPEWEARDRIRRHEAIVMKTRTGARGIAVVPKRETHEIEQGSGIATLEQVEGLPVAGPAIHLFYGTPRKKAA
jgi:hypothetical protein